MSRAQFTPSEHADRRAWIADLPLSLAVLYNGTGKIGRPPTPLISRLLDRINVVDTGYVSPCWLWLGKKDKDGYGQMTVGGGPARDQRVHRVTYQLWVGPLVAGLEPDHLCRVRSCCNPDHLEAITIRENILRGEGTAAMNARKTHCQNGHQFTDDNVYVWHGMRRCLACRRRSAS